MGFFVSKVDKYGNHSVLSNKVLDMIKRCINDINSVSLMKFASESLNKSIKNDCFNNLNGRQFYLFLNLWKVTKALNPEVNLIVSENKKKFSILLKEISKVNARGNVNMLAGLDLSYCDFSKEDLSETIFNNVKMIYCNFQNAYLDTIDLSKSDLSYSKFDYAFMECSYLDYSNCTNVSFAHVHLRSSVVSGANFTNVSLENTNFMECDADRLVVNGLKIDDHTAVNNTDFSYVNWENIDISGIAISDDQISYFWEVVNCTRNTVLYDSKFNKLDNKNIQDVIYKELSKSSKDYLNKMKLSEEKSDVFISYAAEEKGAQAMPMAKKLKKVCQKYDVWIDDPYLTLGDKLRNSIESVIRQCKIAFVFFSENYARKGWTRYELDRLLEEYMERDLRIILIDMTDGTRDLESYIKLKQNIGSQNIYKGDVIDQEKIIVRVQDLLKMDV